MKKGMKTVGTVLVSLVCLSLLPTHAMAATAVDDQATLDIDGTTVLYDNQAVNGGIDRSSTSEVDSTYSKRGARSIPSSVVISIPFQTQQTDYYCGPASARMVLGGIGYSRTQNQMASLLGTTTAGTYAGDGVANALNSVVAGSKYAFRWQWHTYTNVSTIKGHITEALSFGNPVMVNTVEGPGDVWLQGHNIGTALYHFGVVADYFDYGNSVTYTDPGYGRYSGFVQDQRASITNLSYAVGGRGYAW